MVNTKEKIEQAKKRLKNTLITTAIVGAGIGSVAGTSYYVKNEKEEKNNRINTEWKKEFADADSVFADAKTAHFYAHKELQQKDRAELEDYLQKLKNEKQNQMADELCLELLDESCNPETVEKLFADGAKVDRYLMEKVARDPASIQMGDGFEMTKRLFEQYEKYGGYDDVSHQDFTGYDWENIRRGLQKHLAAGHEEYQELVNFASKEIKKAKEEGRYFDQKKENNGFDIRFYAEKYFALHPLSRRDFLTSSDKIEVLDVEIKKTEFQIKTGREYEIDMTSKDTKKILDSNKGIKQSYIEALKLKGKVKE